MNLVLTITNSPEGVSLNQTQYVFGEEGGDIGRADRNTWVLQDPERYISSRHCAIQYENGVYYLVDHSTNGTYLNNSDQPIGKGQRAALSNGMNITVGDYGFTVALANDQSSAIPGVGGPFATDGNNQQATPNIHVEADSGIRDDIPPASSGPDLYQPINITPHHEPVIPGQDNILDPLQAFEQLNRNNNRQHVLDNENQLSAGRQEDHANFAEQAFTPPKILGSETIPEDWDNTEYGYHGKNAHLKNKHTELSLADDGDVAVQEKKPNVAVKSVKRRTVNPVNANPKQKHSKQAVNKKSYTSSNAAIGLDKDAFSQDQLAELNHVVGQFVRHTVEGLLKVLRARSTIKNELRLGVTTVQPTDNNPIKFSADVEDALEHLFVKQSKAYMPPIASVNESFETILDHQVAVLADEVIPGLSLVILTLQDVHVL